MCLQEDMAYEHRPGVHVSKDIPLLPWLGFSHSLLQSKEGVIASVTQPSLKHISGTHTLFKSFVFQKCEVN